MTSAPMRASSKAWRPNPAPASSTRSPRRTPSRSKRMVSTSDAAVPAQLADIVRHRQHLAVLLDGLRRAMVPGPTVDHPPAPGVPDTGAQPGIVEAAADGRGQRVGVAGRGLQHGLTVGAGDLRQGAAIGGL